MSTQTILPVDRDTVASISANRNEASWMSALRLEALELAGQLELPKLEKMKIERWNIGSYGSHKQPAQVGSVAELPESITSLLQEGQDGSNLLVQRNSGVVYAKLSAELAEKGVIFTDLETAAKDHADLVQKYFMQAVTKDENRLTALHAALWNGGVFLYVPKNVEIDTPLQAIFLTDDAQATFAPHLLIVAESNSRVVYVDNYVSAGTQGDAKLVHNGVVEVFVKAGAKVQYASVHNMGEAVTDLNYRRAIVENDGSVEWVVGEMNHGDSMSDTVSILRGNGSTSDAKIIAVGTGEQNLNITTRAVHFGRSSDSQMITRAVMRDSAQSIINGITKIEHGATKANGEQTEKVLMLSPKARGDANPILLIDEDDVTAGHAASVGQVNPEQVYYLMSRGVPKADAERLIIYGFLAPVVSEIPLASVQGQLQAVVERKLGE